MYPSVEERLIDFQQRRIDACIHLPVDHPLQPPMIEPIQSSHVDAEGVDDHTRTDIANIDVSSSKPNSPIQTTQTSTTTSEPSIIQNLVDHYSGELPEYESNQDKASDIAFDEAMTESPQQHEPNQQMTSITNIDFVPELSVSEQTINSQSSTTNTFAELETSVNDQPSSLNLALQPCALARTNVPSPSTLFLDSTILADMCENIF